MLIDHIRLTRPWDRPGQLFGPPAIQIRHSVVQFIPRISSDLWILSAAVVLAQARAPAVQVDFAAGKALPRLPPAAVVCP